MELTEPRWCLHPGTDLTAMHCGINALFSLFNISFFFCQSIELEDVSEADSRGKVSAPTSPLDLDEPKSPKIPEFPLSLLQSQQKCDVYPDLHKIIQVRLRANVVGGVETTFLKHSCHTKRYLVFFLSYRTSSWKSVLSISRLYRPIHIISFTAFHLPKKRCFMEIFHLMF